MVLVPEVHQQRRLNLKVRSAKLRTQGYPRYTRFAEETTVTIEPPLTEMSVAVQFRARQPFTPHAAMTIAERVNDELPTVALKDRIGVLGSQAEPQFIV